MPKKKVILQSNYKVPKYFQFCDNLSKKSIFYLKVEI